MPTAIAPTPYEAALAAVPNAKKVTLPHPARVKEAARKGLLADVAGKMDQEGKAKTAAIRAGKLTKKEKKPAAAKAATGKGSAKAKPRSAGNGSGPAARLTTEWTSAKGKDVKVKDRVKAADGTVLDVIGRWTKKTKDGTLIPMVTGHVVSAATEGKGKEVGDRCNAVAATVTHVKK